MLNLCRTRDSANRSAHRHQRWPSLLLTIEQKRCHSATAPIWRNIDASQTLFRLGIAAHLIGEALFVFVALALYDLFKAVNHRNALCMLTLILVAIPIAFLNELNAVAALVLVHGADFLSLFDFDQPQRDALAMLFLNVHGYGFDVAGIFWDLWLFPLNLSFFRSALHTAHDLIHICCSIIPTESWTR